MTPELYGGETGAQPPCTLSVVVPAFNEEAVLPEFHRRLATALVRIPGACEVIYIDDGSTDRTPQLLRELNILDPSVAVARFSRNFGKESAMSAGLRLARGAAVIVIDADLQHPPEAIPSMVDAWREGADLVNMRRRNRAGENWLRRATAHAFYRAINRMSDVPIPEDVGDFRLLSRRAVDAVNLLPERGRFMKGLSAWVGFRQVTLDFDHHARAAGASKWRYRTLWNFALEGITAFSTVPLKLASYIGLASASGAFLYALYFLLKTLFVGDPARGFPTLIITLLFIGGLQLMAIGVLGTYIGRLFIESKRRPQYLIEDYQPSVLAETERSADRRAANWR
jgi:glycosyltransferase involved in cell wall biosynthesis